MRPLIIVHTEPNSDKKYIKLTPEIVKKFANKEINIDYLIKENIIEYIYSGEQQNCYIAENIDLFNELSNSPNHHFTHLEVEQSLYAISSLVAPYLNHT